MKIRLKTYKSTRYYGGREIKETVHACAASLICKQINGTYLCELLEDCAGYKSGHRIAIRSIDYNINNTNQ